MTAHRLLATTFATTVLCAAIGFAVPAGAEEKAAAVKTESLPGVGGEYSIVTPATDEPEAPQGDGKTFQAGNWEVTVSGYVWVQVGASSGR